MHIFEKLFRLGRSTGAQDKNPKHATHPEDKKPEDKKYDVWASGFCKIGVVHFKIERYNKVDKYIQDKGCITQTAVHMYPINEYLVAHGYEFIQCTFYELGWSMHDSPGWPYLKSYDDFTAFSERGAVDFEESLKRDDYLAFNRIEFFYRKCSLRDGSIRIMYTFGLERTFIDCFCTYHEKVDATIIDFAQERASAFAIEATSMIYDIQRLLHESGEAIVEFRSDNVCKVEVK